MKMLTSAEIREQFLGFFAEHGHASWRARRSFRRMTRRCCSPTLG